MKTTYVDAIKKRGIRETIFRKVNKRILIGLAGPDITQYIKENQARGFQRIFIYENNRNVAFHQMKLIKGFKGIDYHPNTDILNAPLLSDAFYDLDFCNSITDKEPYLKKFRNTHFTITVAIRMIGLQTTLKYFVDFIGEKLVSIDKMNPNEGILYTSQHSYRYTKYYDTSTMVTICKL